MTATQGLSHGDLLRAKLDRFMSNKDAARLIERKKVSYTEFPRDGEENGSCTLIAVHESVDTPECMLLSEKGKNGASVLFLDTGADPPEIIPLSQEHKRLRVTLRVLKILGADPIRATPYGFYEKYAPFVNTTMYNILSTLSKEEVLEIMTYAAQSVHVSVDDYGRKTSFIDVDSPVKLHTKEDLIRALTYGFVHNRWPGTIWEFASGRTTRFVSQRLGLDTYVEKPLQVDLHRQLKVSIYGDIQLTDLRTGATRSIRHNIVPVPVDCENDIPVTDKYPSVRSEIKTLSDLARRVEVLNSPTMAWRNENTAMPDYTDTTTLHKGFRSVILMYEEYSGVTLGGDSLMKMFKMYANTQIAAKDASPPQRQRHMA